MLGVRRSVISRAVSAQRTAVRNFSRSAIVREVQLFDMPSMSPTMEEGGIVEWKVQQGETFKAGDVLLEIETDKAEIAVEAGDDGVLAKVLVEAGVKGIPVGKPIAVTAEEGDDLASIDYDAMINKRGSENAAKEAAKEDNSAKESAKKSTSSASSTSAPASSPEPSSKSSSSSPAPSNTPSHGNHGTEPLPTAMRLIHEHHLNINEIQGSGPHGRITKGDILAHLGKIPKEYPVKEQERFSKLQKMDLSNVEVAPPKATEPKDGGAKGNKTPKPQPLVTSISIPLTTATVGKVATAQRIAMRQALLTLKPKASILRDSILDSLTASSKPPFVVKSAKVQVLRAKPVSLDVVVEEPAAKQPSKAAETFLLTLQSELDITKA